MAANINPAPACLKADVWEHFGFKNKKESDGLDKSMAVQAVSHKREVLWKYHQPASARKTSPPGQGNAN